MVAALASPGGGAVSFGPYRDMLFTLAAGNPISHWTLSELAGDFIDIFGGHDLTVTGAPTRGVAGPLTGGQDLGAVTWAAAGNFASVADNADHDLGDGPFTLIAFSNRLVDTGAFEVMLSKGTDSYALAVSDIDQFTFVRDNVAQIVIDNTGGGYPAGSGWTWWVLSRIATGAGNTSLYRNGGDVTNLIAPAQVVADTATALQVGRDEAGDPPFTGSMAEITIIKGVALTAGNVAALNAVR